MNDTDIPPCVVVFFCETLSWPRSAFLTVTAHCIVLPIPNNASLNCVFNIVTCQNAEDRCFLVFAQTRRTHRGKISSVNYTEEGGPQLRLFIYNQNVFNNV